MIVIVGEAPSRSSDPLRPFDGYSGRKLAEYAGLGSYEELAANAKLANVLGRWPGRGFAGEKGSRFPIARARRAAKKMRFPNGATVLLAGKRVARAFGWEFADYFSWKIAMRGDDGGIVWFVLVPHPSGCNAWFNYESNRERMSRFLRHFVFHQRHGELLREGMAAAC